MIPLGVLASAYVAPAGGGGLAAAYVTSDASSANSTSYTFFGVSLGDAATDRRIHLVVVGRNASTPPITGVTIGGVTATVDVSISDAGTISAIWSASVPTGTTGDVVVTFSATSLRCHIHVYRSTGASSTVAGTSTGTGSAATTDLTVDSVTGGYAIAVSTNTAIGSDATWTGATPDKWTSMEMSSSVASTATSSISTAITVSGYTHAHAAVAYAPA